MNLHTLYTDVRSRTLRLFLFLVHLPVHTAMMAIHIVGALIQAFSGISVGTLSTVQSNTSTLVTSLANAARSIFGDLILIATNPSPVGKIEAGVDAVEESVTVVEDGMKLVDACEKASPAEQASLAKDA